MENVNYNYNNDNRKLFNRVLIFGFALIFLAVSFWLGFYAGRKESGNNSSTDLIIPLDKAIIVNKDRKDSAVDFSLFWKTYDKLKEKYVDSASLDSQKLLYGAIKGLAQSTGDPYTIFLDPDDNKRFDQELTGSFEGIGAEMGIKKGILTIIAPLMDSPAEKAGLKAGDKIVKIDGESTAEMFLEQAVSKIRGPKGTEVKLTIWRDVNTNKTEDIVVKRDIIKVESVRVEFKENNIAYVKISRFIEKTNNEFSSATNKIIANKSKALIIDLRNNPGGYLEDAVAIASKMLPKGKVIVIEESGGKRKEILARGGGVLYDLPVVILINEGSASASEILSGALKDNRQDVTIVGKKSFGKGSVQEKIELPQKTAVKITVARWLTPSGKQINENGINPDIDIDLSDEDYENDRDPQLEKALELIKEKIKQ